MEGGARKPQQVLCRPLFLRRKIKRAQTDWAWKSSNGQRSLDIQLGQAIEYERHRVQPISLQVFEDFRISGALFEPKKSVLSPAFLMAHGHYGEGKSSGEAQGPSHVLADRGYVVLALDTPRGRRVRSTQPTNPLRRGRQKQGCAAVSQQQCNGPPSAWTSGWIGLLEPTRRHPLDRRRGCIGWRRPSLLHSPRGSQRIKALVMASFVPIPRLEKEGGCPCDWVGSQADKAIVTTLGIPSLWMSETHPSAPFHFPKTAGFATSLDPMASRNP